MILLLSVMALTAFGQPENAELRRELRDFYAHQDRLIAAGRDEALLRTFHPEFVGVDTQGKRMTLDQFRAHMASMRRISTGVKAKSVLKHVRTQGSDEAVSWVEQTFTYKARQGSGWANRKQTARYSETFKRTPRGWVIIYSQQLPTNEPWSFKTGS
jgi:uncharacterized protein (TIGR02246 family)